MAKERSDKSNYTSPSTGDYCTEAQYITELFLRREVKKVTGEEPIHQFWNNSPWKGKFKTLSTKVNNLLKNYSATAIIRAMDKVKWAYSPMAKQFLYAAMEEQRKLDMESTETIEADHKKDSKPMKSFQKNKKSKLKDL